MAWVSGIRHTKINSHARDLAISRSVDCGQDKVEDLPNAVLRLTPPQFFYAHLGSDVILIYREPDPWRHYHDGYSLQPQLRRRLGAWILPGDQLNSTIRRVARLLRLRPRHARWVDREAETCSTPSARQSLTARCFGIHVSEMGFHLHENRIGFQRTMRPAPEERGSPLEHCRAYVLERIDDHSLNNMSTLVSGFGDERGLNVGCH